ncbi:unannotated protein [freshwater metagenome]|uniref:Unannotated protein n=1 Tax=freshwater metagenome TaxID=449393 RepID=A0A6J7I812_9ZZZZ
MPAGPGPTGAGPADAGPAAAVPAGDRPTGEAPPAVGARDAPGARATPVPRSPPGLPPASPPRPPPEAYAPRAYGLPVHVAPGDPSPDGRSAPGAASSTAVGVRGRGRADVVGVRGGSSSSPRSRSPTNVARASGPSATLKSRTDAAVTPVIRTAPMSQP